jgi:hypothetical protein
MERKRSPRGPSRRQVLKLSSLGAVALSGQGLSAQGTSPSAPAVTRQTLVTLIQGYQVSQLLHVAAKLRIADLLKEGPRTTAQLAQAAGVHEDALYRVLRTLASMGVFTEGDDRRFQLNPAAEYLRADTRDSLRPLAEILGEEWMWKPWGALIDSVKTGETAFDRVFGMGTFDWFAKHPDAGQLFDVGQTASTIADADAVLAAYDFTRTRRVVDVGAGEGMLVAAVLRAHPALRGVVFDLPAVVERARTRFDQALASRAEFVGGNFFKGVPSGADLYLMKSILHDWNDADCQRILETTRQAMPSTARLLVIEDLVCGPNQPCVAKQRDVNMLVRTGGRNRTEQEYRAVLARGGFRVVRVLPTTSSRFLIESTPS